jgi:Tat protein translocase TatB subunit
MFDIGFLELTLVSIIGLLVLGPERLPVAIRTVTLFFNKLRRSFDSVRAEIERELKTDEIRRDLHNQSIMQELRQTEKELREGLGVDGARIGIDGHLIDEDVPGKDATNQEPTGADAASEDAAGQEPADESDRRIP